eukprot:SAG31_NODE_3100_length_4675_cov_3.664117_4_plen_34_part_00
MFMKLELGKIFTLQIDTVASQVFFLPPGDGLIH